MEERLKQSSEEPHDPPLTVVRSGPVACRRFAKTVRPLYTVHNRSQNNGARLRFVQHATIHAAFRFSTMPDFLLCQMEFAGRLLLACCVVILTAVWGI